MATGLLVPSGATHDKGGNGANGQGALSSSRGHGFSMIVRAREGQPGACKYRLYVMYMYWYPAVCKSGHCKECPREKEYLGVIGGV
jgi:hypothetical protein